MTRRTLPPPRVDPDDFGFNVAGKGFRMTRAELVLMLGLDPLACAVYLRCCKPFTDRAGAVRNASYYRMLELLRPVQSPGGGPRLPAPTVKQLRRCLEHIKQAGLITCYPSSNRDARALQIRVNLGAWSSPKV